MCWSAVSDLFLRHRKLPKREELGVGKEGQTEAHQRGRLGFPKGSQSLGPWKRAVLERGQDRETRLPDLEHSHVFSGYNCLKIPLILEEI